MTGRALPAIMIAVLSLSAPRFVAAQQGTLPVIGYLTAGRPTAEGTAVLRKGLADGGFFVGRDFTIETRSADGRYERLPELAADLVARRVFAIVADAPTSALAAERTTATIPIIFFMGANPVAEGLVQSLNQPGGNVTGVTFLSNQLDGKRLEMLHRLVPRATTIAALANPTNPNTATELGDIADATKSLGLSFVVIRGSTNSEVMAALDEAVRQKAMAIHVLSDRFLTDESPRIADFAIRHGIATSYFNPAAAASGGFMAYGADIFDAMRQAGLYTARILKGEKPADMPVIQSSKFVFVLNLKTAKALWLAIDPNLARLRIR